MPETVEASVASTAVPLGQLREKLKPGPGRSASAVAEHQRARIRAAMLALVAERGYRAVTVRELAQVAGVSSRAFYTHYSSKEECFLSTHESIARRIDRKIAVAQEGEKDWRACLRLTIDVYMHELQSDLQEARLLLVDSYVAGQPALGHVRCAERAFEVRLLKCFNLVATDVALPSLVARGMSGGIMCVARSHLTSDPTNDLTDLSESLASWAGAVFEAALSLSPSAGVQTGSDQSYALTRANHRLSWPVVDERGLIITALAKLAASERYQEMTMRKVRISAGASTRKFTAHFRSMDDCFMEAAELYVTTVVAEITADPIGALCERVANDSAFATLCFADIFAPGLSGVRCLTSVIKELEVALSADLADSGVSSVALEASAAGVWAALRDEVLCGRRMRSAKVSSQLRLLASAWAEEAKDRKRFGQQFDHLSPKQDARGAYGRRSSNLAASAQ